MADESEHIQETYGIEAYDPGASIASRLDEMDSHGQAVFNVYEQLEGNTSKMPFLFTVPADQYSIEQLLSKIASEYGGGNYRVHLRGPTEAGSNQLIANQVFPVKAPKTPPEPAKTAGTDTDKLLEYMRERDRKTDEQLQEMRRELNEARNRPANETDPFQAMERAMGVMSQMHGMMPQGNNGAAKGKEKSLMEQIREAKEISEFFQSNSGEQSEFTSLLREGVGPLIELAKAQRGNPQNPQQGKTEMHAPESATNNAAQPNNMDQIIGGHVQFLLKAAEKNGDPEVYADMVLDFTPQEYYGQLHEFLSQPNAIDVLAQKVPPISQHGEWFTALQAAILSNLDVGDTGGETDAHATPTGDNPTTGHRDPDRGSGGPHGDTPDPAGYVEDGGGGKNALADP